MVMHFLHFELIQSFSVLWTLDWLCVILGSFEVFWFYLGFFFFLHCLHRGILLQRRSIQLYGEQKKPSHLWHINWVTCCSVTLCSEAFDPWLKCYAWSLFTDCPLFRGLFRDALLPDDVHIVGFARSNLTVESIKTACLPYMKVKAPWWLQ